MRLIPVLLASAALGAGAVGAVVKLSPASSPLMSRLDWEHRRAGPDSGRVAILIDALGKTDPVVCELIGDQIGNFWWSGGRDGIGRLAAAPNGLQAAKDSVGGTITDPRAIERLIVELNASNPCVRRVASKMLGRSDISAARLTSLLSDASPNVREAAALTAGNGEHHDVRVALEKSLDDRVPAVAAMAAYALGELGDHASLPVLLNAVRSAEPRVRESAIWALGQLKSEETIAPIERALGSDTDARVRAAAASALGEISSATSLKALGNALDDADITVRRAAASALAELDESHSAAPGLVRALGSGDAELRHLAARALCAIADPATTSTLIGLLSTPDADIRKSAIEALGKIGSPSAVSGLMRALTDKDPDVRRAAAEALGEIKDK